MIVYRPKFVCECTDCKYNDWDGDCKSEWVTISNDTMTPAGFLPVCLEYEESEVSDADCD